MRRRIAAIALLAAIALCYPSLDRAGVPAALADDPAAVTLTFRKPEGQTLFDQGKAQFAEGKYAEAFDSFRDARKHASDLVTKKEVDRWSEGARGGNELVELRKMAETDKAAAAHQHAAESLEKFRDTPIGEEYAKFVEELEKKLFTVLENFDVESNRFSEKFGKTFVEDPAMVKQGRRSLRWEVDKENFELKVKGLPDPMTDYEGGAVVYWLHFDKRGAPYRAIFTVPGKSTSLHGDEYSNIYFKEMQAHEGWKRIEIPLKQFTAQGDVDWARVRDFRLYFQGGRKLTVHVDCISLRK